MTFIFSFVKLETLNLNLAVKQDNVLYFDPFTFSDSGYYYCRISHNLCVVAEVTKGKLDDYFTSKKIFLRPERGSLVIAR